jgi:general stress protein YciG
MKESRKHVREYLAEIGRRGGEKSRRDLFPTHAKKMVAIREMKRAALRAGKPWPPRDRKSRKLLKVS